MSISCVFFTDKSRQTNRKFNIFWQLRQFLKYFGWITKKFLWDLQFRFYPFMTENFLHIFGRKFSLKFIIYSKWTETFLQFRFFEFIAENFLHTCGRKFCLKLIKDIKWTENFLWIKSGVLDWQNIFCEIRNIYWIDRIFFVK